MHGRRIRSVNVAVASMLQIAEQTRSGERPHADRLLRDRPCSASGDATTHSRSASTYWRKISWTAATLTDISISLAPEELSHCERHHSTVTQYLCLFATQSNSGPPPLTIESARR